MARALIGLVAVIGIVAMHGLTMNHDAAMASTDGSLTTSMTLHATSSGHGAVVTDAQAMRSVPDVTPLVPAEGAAAFAGRVLRAGTAHGTHPATACCLAFLTGLLLLLGMGRLLARRRSGTQAAALLRHAVEWLATVVEPLRPDLAELSVLRT